MKIIIEETNKEVSIRESNDCEESEVINAYAYALAMKCKSMFKHKENAISLLDMAYQTSKIALDKLYKK